MSTWVTLFTHVCKKHSILGLRQEVGWIHPWNLKLFLVNDYGFLYISIKTLSGVPSLYSYFPLIQSGRGLLPLARTQMNTFIKGCDLKWEGICNSVILHEPIYIPISYFTTSASRKPGKPLLGSFLRQRTHCMVNMLNGDWWPFRAGAWTGSDQVPCVQHWHILFLNPE